MLDKQEEYIRYLYSVIDILKQKLHDSELQYKNCSGKQQILSFSNNKMAEGSESRRESLGESLASLPHHELHL